MSSVWRGTTAVAMKLRCQIFGTPVLFAYGALAFVLQRLTVLLSYYIVASVPLFGAPVRWKMGVVRMELNRC
jgi:hypothetical protein